MSTMDDNDKYCGSCDEELYPQIIQCMSCERYFHWECVGVDWTIEEEEEWWLCEKCHSWTYGSQDTNSDSGDERSSNSSNNSTSSGKSNKAESTSSRDSNGTSARDQADIEIYSTEFTTTTAETVNPQVIRPRKSTETLAPANNVLARDQQVSKTPTAEIVKVQQVIKPANSNTRMKIQQRPIISLAIREIGIKASNGYKSRNLPQDKNSSKQRPPIGHKFKKQEAEVKSSSKAENTSKPPNYQEMNANTRQRFNRPLEHQPKSLIVEIYNFKGPELSKTDDTCNQRKDFELKQFNNQRRDKITMSCEERAPICEVQVYTTYDKRMGFDIGKKSIIKHQGFHVPQQPHQYINISRSTNWFMVNALTIISSMAHKVQTVVSLNAYLAKVVERIFWYWIARLSKLIILSIFIEEKSKKALTKLEVLKSRLKINIQVHKVKVKRASETDTGVNGQVRQLEIWNSAHNLVALEVPSKPESNLANPEEYRNEKRWGVLFTCLTIRAIHIELAPSLDTNSCILCIGNFIADRGAVVEFHSDCGTNFVGANNELKKELEKLDPEKLQTEFTSRYTNWIFNPPAAAHMGGSWERLIRSTKSGMFFTLPTRTPKEETLRNILKEIQNVVNSRPLTYIPLETEEDEALTPNHFLHGSSSGMKPPCELNVDGEYLRKSWKEAQRITELFWKRFTKEYLPTIARRTKWFKPTKPLSPNDLVLVVDENNARNTYPKAKVLQTIIGSNGQVRRAKIQLIADAKIGRGGKICEVHKTEMWRPAHKLALLDVLSKPEDSLAKLEVDRKTGGRMLETNDSSGVRRSLRNTRKSGNTSR